MAWKRSTTTHTAAGALKHSPDCRMAFGKKDPTCPRCQELLNGASPRGSYHSHRAQQEADRLRWLREHNCKTSGCGPVCTYGDW